MLLERHESLLPLESHPNNLDQILSRFGTEYQREQLALSDPSWIASLVLKANGEKFDMEHPLSDCPFQKYVLAESFLVGLSNPTDIERLDKILCGNTVIYRNDLGFMSGERSKTYKPMSQCWKLTIELAWLTEFMKKNEDLPEISAEDEEEIRNVLNQRERIGRENKSRQMVFSTWKELKTQLEGKFSTQNNQALLPSPQKTGFSNTSLAKPDSTEITSQLNIGGPEYWEVIQWVEKTVLDPMLQLVGNTNTDLYLKRDLTICFRDDTADACPKKPRGGYTGTM